MDFGSVLGGLNTSGIYLGLMQGLTWVIIIVFFGGLAYVGLFLRNFRTKVIIYNERNDGSVIKKSTMGGFMFNAKTKVTCFRILNDLKSVIKPIPNNMICKISNRLTEEKLTDEEKERLQKSLKEYETINLDANYLKKYVTSRDGKDVIYFRKTAYDEYIPMLMKEELIFLDTKGIERKTFVVSSEFLKGWLKIKHIELRNKFSISDFIEKYGVIISLGFIVVIFILSMKWQGDRLDHLVSSITSTARIVGVGAP